MKDFDKCNILDVCCGSRTFYFQKNHAKVIYMDIRDEEFVFPERKIRVKPDIVGDFRDIPFRDNRFDLVIFDPPHLSNVGNTGMFKAKYGKLDENWRVDYKHGFEECLRVLKDTGTLIFKWSATEVPVSEILEVFGVAPLFGQRRITKGKTPTHWMVFIK